MRTRNTDPLRIALLVLTILGLAWSLGIALSGGFVFRVGGVRISSRAVWRPLALTVCLAAAYVALARGRGLKSDLTILVRGIAEPRIAAVLLAVSVVALGIVFGSCAAGGLDAYGYVSQVELWQRGDLHVSQPWSSAFHWQDARWAAVPLGYRPAIVPGAIVPIYSPGLPMLMALAKLLAGACAVFLVVPLMGGAAVWFTYRLGAACFEPIVGLMAAALLAAGPAFLHMLMSPMSDVPATAAWAAAMALAARQGVWPAVASGLASSLAVLIRPNLAPIGAVVVIAMVLPRAHVVGGRWVRASAYTAGLLPGALIVAGVNHALYGSPLRSGYLLGGLYEWRYALTNVPAYLERLIETQTPLILLAPLALLLIPRQRMEHVPIATGVLFWGAVAVVSLNYIFYYPYEEWWFLRFLLPAYPPALVLSAAAALAILRRSMGSRAGYASALLVTAVSGYQIAVAIDRLTFGIRELEQRYISVGSYVARSMPPNAFFLSMQHSGSLRYYSGRLTARYDVMRVGDMLYTIQRARELGYRPYILLEQWEEDEFRKLFGGGGGAIGNLDVQVVAELEKPVRVRVYDPLQPASSDPPALVPSVEECFCGGKR